ncbi:hypothetical protein E5980_19265 [Klebsiella variicola]|nr:hypothetical protein E5980_19265 [Klebsiella variicola]TKI29161.1 hypothetical protein FCN82_19900 [Klebsiella variicola]
MASRSAAGSHGCRWWILPIIITYLEYKTAFHFITLYPHRHCHTSTVSPFFALAHFSAGKRLPVCE